MIVTLSIGNSDNKLTQEEWSVFSSSVHVYVFQYCTHVHFAGSSPSTSKYQNAAWVFEIDEALADKLKGRLKSLCAKFNQESIAWTIGETEFIQP